MTLQARLTALANAVGADIKSLNGKVLASGAVLLDAWHLVGTAGEPAFSNANWKNYGAGTTPVGFRKDPLGRVALKGSVGVQTAQIATGTNIFKLPAGYWPPTNLIFDVRTASGASDTNARVDVLTDGNLLFQNIGTSGPAPVGVLISLDGLSFDTESVTQMVTGPQGPQGPVGPIGVVQDEGVALTARSGLNFVGAGVTATDDAANNRTIVTVNAAVVPRVTSLPGSPVDGQEVYWSVDTASGAVWHMRYSTVTSKWECVGGNPIVYMQEGENNAYSAYLNGYHVTVNAAATKLLQWQFTPPINCWVEVEMQSGLTQKTNAAYNYSQLVAQITPTPPIGVVGASSYIEQHSAVQTYETYHINKRYALNAGVAYQMYWDWVTDGGNWQYYQGPAQLWMQGKAWPR